MDDSISYFSTTSPSSAFAVDSVSTSHVVTSVVDAPFSSSQHSDASGSAAMIVDDSKGDDPFPFSS